MSVGYYKVDLSYTGYNLDGTVAVLREWCPRRPAGQAHHQLSAIR